MGLFSFKKGQKEENTDTQNGAVVEFEGIIVETYDVAQELKKVSQKYQIPLISLDFNIIVFKIFCKMPNETEWKELKKEELNSLKDQSVFLDPKFEIKQGYKAEIFKKYDSNRFPLEIVLGGNKTLTKIIITIREKDDIEYYPEFEEDFIKEINKKKVRANILIGILDEKVREEIKKIVSSIRVNKAVNEKITLTVCEGIDRVSSRNDDLIYHYKKEHENSQKKERMDHSNRGNFLAVKKDEPIIEYIKPKRGKVGRNCKGKFLGISEPKVKFEKKITVTENVLIKEDSDKILYVAKQNGYINEIEPNKFDIQDQIVLKEATFKSTGSIETGVDKDIKINIKDADSLKDAIGSGVHIETTEIVVEGNVGSSAKIDAVKVEVGGQTHQSSKIYAKNVEVNIHKGYIEADNVEIIRLEGGKVVADTVKVSQISGGEIIAREIRIDLLMSNSKLKASDLIEIRTLKGANNKLLIDPTAQKGYHKKVEKIKKDIRLIKNLIEHYIKRFKSLRQRIDAEAENVKKLHDRIDEIKQKGDQPPISFFTKLKEHQKKIDEHNELIKSVKDEKLRKEELEYQLTQMQSSVFRAKVVNKSKWREYNEIKFKILNPPMQYTHMPKEGEVSRVISLEACKNNQFRIERKGEFD